jgi:hypothetical protein
MIHAQSTVRNDYEMSETQYSTACQINAAFTSNAQLLAVEQTARPTKAESTARP